MTNTLRQQAEEQALANEAKSGCVILSPEEMREALHELNVHQIELEMQNEELRRTQMALDAVKERYFDLYDLAPIGYVTVGEKGIIIDANLTAATMFGTNRSNLSKKRFSTLILKQDQSIYYQLHNDLVATSMPQARDLRMVKSDGAEFWANLSATVGRDGDEQAVSYVVISDITARKQAEDIISASLREKEVLLREIHHRVKNNLQIISSLLSLQELRVVNTESLNILAESRGRVLSMALIHDQLYRSNSPSGIDAGDYLRTLLPRLISTYKGPHDINFQLDAPALNLSLDQAIPFGLIMNELVTNAMKHAFGDRNQGNFRVSVSQYGDEIVVLIEDDGVGLPDDFSLESVTSLGLQIVIALAGQLHGTFRVENPAKACLRLQFPLNRV